MTTNLWQQAMKEYKDPNNATRTYELIPDGTKVVVEIAAITESEFDGPPFLNFQYKVIMGEYKGRTVFQKFRIFQEDEVGNKARFRLLKLYDACETQIPNDTPDLKRATELTGKTVELKLGVYDAPTGKKYQTVLYVSKAYGDFQEEMKPAKIEEINQTDLDNDDIPF